MPSLLENLDALRARLARPFDDTEMSRRNAQERLHSVEAGNLSTLPTLFGLLFDEDAQIASEVAEAIARLIARTPKRDWRQFEPPMRTYVNYWMPYPNIAPQRLGEFSRFGDKQTILLGLASFHASGYVREAAVKRLASNTDGDELPFLLLRVNDWVAPVHDAAVVACSARLTPEYARHFAANLPLVLLLTDARRHDLTLFVSSVEALLTRPECRRELLDGMDASDAMVRRTCFRLAFAAQSDDLTPIFQKTFASFDPAVRRNAARALRALPSGDAVQTAFLSRLSHDKLPANRREYLYLVDEKYPERAASALRNALTDENANVRETARFYLRKRENIDLAQFYRMTLSGPEPSKLAAAIAGLGETGTQNDAAQVVEYLQNDAADMRRAAVTAVGKLDGAAFQSQLLDALNDETSRVSRAALAALTPHLTNLDDEQLWQRFETATIYYGIGNSLRLMLEMTKWRGGVLIVKAHARASRQEKSAYFDRTQATLTRWLARFNQSASLPTREQLAEIKTSAKDLDETTRLPVEEILRRAERLL